MSNITWDDKNKNAPEGDPRRYFTDADANEVKEAVNSKEDSDNKNAQDGYAGLDSNARLPDFLFSAEVIQALEVGPDPASSDIVLPGDGIGPAIWKLQNQIAALDSDIFPIGIPGPVALAAAYNRKVLMWSANTSGNPVIPSDTIDPDIPTGYYVDVIQMDPTPLTMGWSPTVGCSVFVKSSHTSNKGQWSVLRFTKIGGNTWVVTGDTQ